MNNERHDDSARANTDSEDVRPIELKRCCLHLRHKLMYCDERQMAPGQIDDSSDTRVFFCIKTMQVLGPDGESVSPKECDPNRSCYCSPRSSAMLSG